MERILVYGLSSQWGGMEAIIHSIIYELEDKIAFDILLSGAEINTSHKNHGTNVSIIPITSWGSNSMKFRMELKEIICSQKYDYVWINASLMSNRDIISIVKKYSNAEIITHSHGVYFEEKNKFKELVLLFLHKINRSYFNKNVKFKFMCSEASGKWFYGEKSLKEGRLHLIKNGIKTDKFKFDKTTREIIRTNLGFTDEKILLHAGRLIEVKNQKFLLYLLRDMIALEMNVKLLIVGEGELYQELESLISILNLKDYAFLLGARSNIEQFYQAADVFLLPSFHEGFPVTLTEAQTAGLPCIVSNYVSIETNITGVVKYLPIDNSSYSEWIKEINKIFFKPEERINISNLVSKNNFDIKNVANDFKDTLGINFSS